jgi:hypothetical protein
LAGNQPILIGKEVQLVDMTDPLAPVRTSDQKYREIVSALKLQCEDAVALDDAIVAFGNKAIGYYR